MSDETPREYTAAECRQMFLDQVRAYVYYWARPETKVDPEPGRPEVYARVSGMAFSLLNILDGTSGLPAFLVCPSPHPDDKEYDREQGDNWWPENSEIEEKARGSLHQGGYLHDEFYAPDRGDDNPKPADVMFLPFTREQVEHWAADPYTVNMGSVSRAARMRLGLPPEEF